MSTLYLYWLCDSALHNLVLSFFPLNLRDLRLAPKVLRDLVITSWSSPAERLSSHTTKPVTYKWILQGRTNRWGIKLVGDFLTRKYHHPWVAARPVNYRKATVKMVSRTNNCVSWPLVSVLLLVLAKSSCHHPHYMVGPFSFDWSWDQLDFHVFITARS